MKRLLREESGFTLVELIIVCVLLGIVMVGLSNVLVSGIRASSDAQARMTSQQNVRLAFDRLEFEARCATSATILGSGQGVKLTLPTQCSHAAGTVSWCVTGGVFTRYVAASCAGASTIKYVNSITSATPFSLLTATGTLPRLRLALTVNTTNRPSDAFTLTDAIAMRNAAAS
jgi:prepilin-type N-terminal cleavage/methylation domain-containing protein